MTSYRFTKTPDVEGALQEEDFKPLSGSSPSKNAGFTNPAYQNTSGSLPPIPPSNRHGVRIDESIEDSRSARTICGFDRTKLAVLCILVTELCERLTFYSLVANMVLFGTSVLKYSSTDAATLSLVFTGTCYFIPLLGGWVADSWIGKYNTILGSGLIYIAGTIVIVAVGINYKDDFGKDSDNLYFDLSVNGKRGFFIVGLGLIAVGTGGIKVNVSPFGAEQLAGLGEEAVQSFFNWFYWFINVGAGIAYTLVAYVQQEVGFDVGFAIPAGSMVLGVIAFVAARNLYKTESSGASPLADVISLMRQGTSRKKDSSQRYVLPSFLDYASTQHGGTHTPDEVEGVKTLGRVIPIFVLMILYWTIYFQMQSTFFLQSERMDISLGSDFKFPAASLSIFNSVVILLLLPFVDKVFYPFMDKYVVKLTLLKRMGIGMVLAALGMVTAGILEIYRRESVNDHGCLNQEVGDQTFCASEISIFAQVPCFVLIGASEVFASVAGLEFAYSQAPKQLQGVVMGMWLVTSGLGSYLGSALVNIVNAASDDVWLPEELNDGRAEFYFFLLAGLMVADFIVFILVSRLYTPPNYGGTGSAFEHTETEALLKGTSDSALYESVY